MIGLPFVFLLNVVDSSGKSRSRALHVPFHINLFFVYFLLF